MQVKALEYVLEGDEKSAVLLVFLQGWPDNNRMWDWLNWNQQLMHFRLMFINFPNSTPSQPTVAWGQDFPEIIDRLHATVQLAGEFDKKILVAHDWGCTYGYLFDKTHPKYFDQIIAMDVPAYVQLTTISQTLMVFAYQFFLIIAFLIGGRVGKWMTQRCAQFFRHNPSYFKEIDSTRNYPYWYFMKNKVLSLLSPSVGFLHRYVPSVPVAYVFAKNKPFHFHGPKWLTYLANSKDCEVHGLDAGHWIMKKHPKFLTELILRRARL